MRVILAKVLALLATWFTVDACLGTRAYASVIALIAVYILALVVVIPFAHDSKETPNA